MRRSPESWRKPPPGRASAADSPAPPRSSPALHTSRPHTATRAERLVAAAQAQWMAGSDSNALRLVREAIPDITDPFTRARAQRLEAAVFASRRPWTESWLQVIDDARAIPGADVGFVRSTLLDAFAANIGHLEPLQVLAQIGQTMPLPADATPTPSDLLLEGLCLAHGAGDDDAAAAAMLRRSFAELDPAQANSDRCIHAVALRVHGRGDHRRLPSAATTWGPGSSSLGRELAAPVPVYIGLTAIAASEHGTGSLTSALRRWSLDGEAIRDYLPAAMFVGDVIALAWRGDEHGAACPGSVTQTRWMADHNRVADQALLDWAFAVLENGLGNYEAAFHHATQADPGASLVGDQVLLELVESAARSGRRDVAVGTIDRLAHRAQTNPGPLFAGFVARSRALVADDRTADDLYREAIELFRSADAPCHLARCHLVYGEWLRRQKRRSDAREQLREAHRSFVDMGARRFRRADSKRAGRHRRDGAQAEHRDGPRPHPTRRADRATRSQRRHERRDRLEDVPQRSDDRLPPPKGVPKARRDLSP